MESTEVQVTRRSIKYAFLDVIQFSSRSAEAQSDIVRLLNEIVSDCLNRFEVKEEEDRILIPTGDGMCIAFISHTLPYDVHIQIALDILTSLAASNKTILDQTRQFQIRIGINQNTDIIVTDINNRMNVAGAGINMASRIMDQADGNHILVSRAVYDELQPSERYMDKFHIFHAKGKHEISFTVYQYVGENHEGLNTETPTAFLKKNEAGKPEIKLTRLVAYYFAQAIKNKSIIVKRGQETDAVAIPILLYFLAIDSVGMAESTEIRPYKPLTYEYGRMGFDEQLDFYKGQYFILQLEFSELLASSVLSDYLVYLETGMTSYSYIFINSEGVNKLKREWPDIWNEFELDKYI